MEQEGEESTVKAFTINYELNLISAGEGIKFWGNDLKMKSNKIKRSEKYSILFDLNNGRMAATKYNGEIDIINLYSREIEFTLTGHTKKIVAICAIDTENIREHIIATVSYDHTIRFWNILNRECIRVKEGINTYTSILIYEPRRKYLISSSTDTVTIMDYNTDLHIIRTIPHGEVAKIYQLLQISEEQMISINFGKFSLKIWNIDNGETIKDISIPNSRGFVCGALLDKNTLILGEIDTGSVFLYDLNTYTVTNSYQIHLAGKNIIQLCTLNATEAISCSEDNAIILFEIKTGKVKIIFNEYKDEVNSILPVLLHLNAQFVNVLDITAEYIIKIGEYEYTIGTDLLHRIAPKFILNIHKLPGNVIQIEYMDPHKSFNSVFKPFIDNNLIINKDNLAEAILLGKYFPLINIQYERFIKQNFDNLIQLFNINKVNVQLLNSIFPNQAQNISNHYLCI